MQLTSYDLKFLTYQLSLFVKIYGNVPSKSRLDFDSVVLYDFVKLI